MKNKLKKDFMPMWKRLWPTRKSELTGKLEPLPFPKPTKEYGNYVRHQINKANRAKKEGKI